MAVSAYNAQVLRELNYQCPIVIRPILIPFSDYAKAPDPEVMARYENDGYTNFVFVGRIAPNKKQEDVIRAFYCYKKYCNPKSRLFLVGSYQGMERYYHRCAAMWVHWSWTTWSLRDTSPFRRFWRTTTSPTCSSA